MSDANLPLSGAVSQLLRSWQSVLSTMTGQLGLINVNLGKASNPAIEEEVLSNVASYGKQLGRLQDGLIVILNHLDLQHLDNQETRAIYDLAQLLNDIADLKERHYKENHDSKAVLRPKVQVSIRP
ncbi:hypothetical protein [Bradyrhizobium sp. CCGUVB23]|uniref:hypothetical protein n=1 Tax=Bradyrhizobium sp. CCGUVB23 TaxID=2949630 RepID=UPI0020B21D18|nr:hypothetical protein [Bradyrhizobium sp. CCGUVB23]MCP3460567.1 hypothetical protein [Bradyrhizobium sp. CCGUVB23]